MLAIDTPALTPMRGGLLQVAEVITTDGAGGILLNGVTYNAHLCGKNRMIPAEGQNKTFDEQTVMSGTPFTLYRGVEGAMLVDRAGALTEAQSAYSAGESYGVERGLQETVLSPLAVDITPTPGTAVTNHRHALGLLEQYAADNYSGLPIISGNRLAISYLPELQVGDNYELHTIHGTPVVSAAGYSTDGPGAAVAGVGKAWLYVSGKITVWKGPGGAYEAYDLEGNRVYALAEATYVTTVECFAAAILVGI